MAYKIWLVLICFCSSVVSSSAQFIDTTADRVKTPLQVPLKRIGSLQPRNTMEIKSSRITVGCETLDRDLAVWDNYKAYLKPLGVKKIRLQAGWAKCEKVRGVYDWEWLDNIINYAVANGLEPWLQPSYGNPVYPGGGGTGLLNSLMQSPEAYEAWDKWVAALVNRYKNRVKEWEIWNEPDHPMQKISPETTAELNIRTAVIIKRIQPEAKIAGLAFASNSNRDYLDRFLKVIADKGKLDLFHWISYHSYNIRPEDSYREQNVAGLKKVMQRYSENLLLRQGENGAPSTYIPSFALSEIYWTEYTQAKYNMRRLIGDLGHDIETSVFTIIDIYYKPVLNTKGLIQSDVTMQAIRPKVAYYSVQNIASVFDSDISLNRLFKWNNMGKLAMSVHGFQHQSTRQNMVAYWVDSLPPTNSFQTSIIDLKVENAGFKDPVLVDVMTGNIYEIPLQNWSTNGISTHFSGLPVYDAPMLVAEKTMLKMTSF